MHSLAFSSSSSMSGRNVNILTQRSGNIRLTWLFSLHINTGCTFVWLKSISLEAPCQLFSLPFFQLAWHSTTCSVLPDVCEAKWCKNSERKALFRLALFKGLQDIAEEIGSNITFQNLFEMCVRFSWLCKDYKKW